jgi:hypothetical protein
MTTNIQLAKEVAKYVQLRSVSLKRALVEACSEVDEAPEVLTVAHEHRCTYSEATGDDRLIHVFADFRFSASGEGEGAAQVAKLEAQFVLTYEVPKGIALEPQCLKHFADLNGTYNAWPYWRELVQTATGRIGLGSFVIPVYRPAVAEVHDGAKKSDACVQVAEG